jgi:uncharacterized short protein YbdD (DUF466 family)
VRASSHASGNADAATTPWWRRATAVLRRIIGVPDYASYLAHVKQCHPDRIPLTESEFVSERLKARYEQPGNRCC